MRRSFEEISDEEWDNHSFKPSRVLKKPAPSPAPPAIESFAYRPNPPSPIILDEDDENDFCEVRNPVRPPTAQGGRARRFIVEDEDDVDDGVVVVTENGSASTITRPPLSQGQVLELRSSDEEFSWTEDEDEKEEEREVEEEQEEEEEEEEEEEVMEEVKWHDVVGRALRKCARISSALRRELFGSTTSACDRYSEVEASSCRIVTQEDVNVACESDELDFEPILKPYQLVGVNFLLLLYRKNIGGAILADEMGLGKTIQAVTYLALLKHLDNDPGPHLIVCPASLLENWERELKRWCPSFSVILFHGPGKTTYSKMWSSRARAGLPAPFNVLLVCYSLFERRSEQQKDDRKTLKRWQWSCVLMDEAHLLKDKNSYRWKNLMSVAKSAHQRLMLTGTPLQNDLHELWSLLEFMLPDIFATEYVDLKKLLNAEDKDLISRIKSILGPFILRRLKSDVMQQLVPKTQNVRYVHMTSEQSIAYEDAINEYRAASRARFGRSSLCTISNVVDLLPKRQISNYFTQFRKIANHPLLVRRFYHDEDVVRIANILYPKGVFGFECSIDRAIQEIKGYNDFEIHQLLISYGDDGTKGVLNDEHVLGSAKCQVLAELLPILERDGHRVLIFSQWTHMLDILEWTLDVIGVTYRRLDGSTQVLERQTIVDTFNSDPSIFACLLSTRSGGQGLNLIGADTVIIHDMDFNPQVDRQAEDRCHRIGQVKPVTVYRLVTKNTVDENIYEIARRKLVLDAAVLQCGTVLDDEVDLPEKTMGEILSALLLA